MTLLRDAMDAMLIAVGWRDAMGTKLWDATTLLRLPNTLHAIEKEGGKVRAIRWLERL
jgi:hypothetical protein